MRIVIDMQGAQTESRFRGIGRYTMSLAHAIVCNRGEHEIILALSGLFPDTIEPIRVAFEGLLPQENIRVWHGVGPTRECDPTNAARRQVAECVREATIACMQPDVVLISSLFEGFGDDAATSIGLFDEQTPTVCILYDLIPLISPDDNFKNNSIIIAYYQRKLASLKRAKALLAISASSRLEAVDVLQYPPEAITTISSGCDPCFQPMPLSAPERAAFFARLGLDKAYVMYTGGADERKNLHRLIEAFAALPSDLRASHQLVMVGKMPESNIVALQVTAKRVGLKAGELIFTGFVSDNELMQLYTACKLFVFPSLHEGFGLPPLEAMGCGAPVIASNATSLPEVVGRDDVLFDPCSVTAIATKMTEVLVDDVFRAELVRYGAERVKAFSWDDSARKALEVLAQVACPSNIVCVTTEVQETQTGLFKPKEQRILVSKLDHMGDLVLAIPAITKLRTRYPHARIDALVGSWNQEAARLLGVFEHIFVLDYFSKKSAEVARTPDVLNDLISQMPDYDIALDLRRPGDTRFILVQLPARIHAGYASGDPLVDARLAICLPTVPDIPFSASELNRTSIALQMLRVVDALPADSNDYVQIIQPVHRQAIRVGSVAIFPNAGNAVKEWGEENYKDLIRVLATDVAVKNLGVFVGSEAEARPYKAMELSKLIVYSGLPYQALLEALAEYEVCVANNSFGAHLASWIGLRVIGVYGGHETVAEWGPVFGDCRILHVPVPCSPCHIPDNDACVNDFKCLKSITPVHVHYAVCAALEGAKLVSTVDIQMQLVKHIATDLSTFRESELICLADCIAQNTSVRNFKRLFVDISELVSRDACTGIQRVVRSVLKEWLLNPPEGYRVEPVYATINQGYRYARQFTQRFLGLPIEALDDEPIDYAPGDFFFGLDLQPQVQVAQRDFYQTLRRQGVRVQFMIYDLLCVLMPQYFPPGAAEGFASWLSVVAESDGAVCISKAVADELEGWIEANGAERQRPFIVNWFHLGADVDNSHPTLGLPADAESTLARLRACPSFLIVGTLEPRKGHAQVLDAFEHLWYKGANANLVIVGKQGWMVDALVERLHAHPEWNHRLFWLEGISDEYLEKAYAASTCLIAASYGEGFGLPLIEAAQHKLPIIARDIPVFREVAGEHAFYFEDNVSPQVITVTVEEWLVLYKQNLHPKSEKMAWMTWKQSADKLLNEASLKIKRSGGLY